MCVCVVRRDEHSECDAGREEAPGPGDLLRVGADAEVGSEVTCSEFGQI